MFFEIEPNMITHFISICSIGVDWHAVEVEWLNSIYLNRPVQLDWFFQLISQSVSYIAWGFPLVLLTIGLLQRNVVLKRKAIVVWASVILASLISLILKYVIDRQRPFDSYPFIEKLSSGGSPSFPSGHTTDAFAIAIALILAYPRWYFTLPALLWASAVGYSRMSLGVHYPSDVFFGIILGAVSAYICFKGKDYILWKKSNML